MIMTPMNRRSLLLMAGIAALPLKGEAFDLLGRPTFSPAIAIATSVVLGTIGTFATTRPRGRTFAPCLNWPT